MTGGGSGVCSIGALVDALCRDGTSEISRDPRTKRLEPTRKMLQLNKNHTSIPTSFFTHNLNCVL